MQDFKIGDIVKNSKHYFSVLAEAGCTKWEMESEKEDIFEIVEIPASHGSESSIGISPVNGPDTVIACTKKDIVLK